MSYAALLVKHVRAASLVALVATKRRHRVSFSGISASKRALLIFQSSTRVFVRNAIRIAKLATLSTQLTSAQRATMATI